MQDYRVFGGVLRSAVAYPELPTGSADEADWTLESGEAPPPSLEAELLGEDAVGPQVRVRLYRLPDGFRVGYDDVGSFDVQRGGRRIRWFPGPRPEAVAVSYHVLDRVLPTAMHSRGTLCLHGSAVSVGGCGIAFVAPMHHGKSTLAQAMVGAGALLASDDVVPITPGPPALMAPGAPLVRLWRDAFVQLAPEGLGRTDLPFAKYKVRALPSHRLSQGEVPLAAIYVLRPRMAQAGEPAVRRTLLRPIAATLDLLRNTKLGPLLGKCEAARLLQRVTALVQAVPVYELELVRGWPQLAEAVEQLHAWHSA